MNIRSGLRFSVVEQSWILFSYVSLIWVGLFSFHCCFEGGGVILCVRVSDHVDIILQENSDQVPADRKHQELFHD